MDDTKAPVGTYTRHDIGGVGSFDIVTDGKIHDEMHGGIRDGSQFTHASVRYVLDRLQAGDRFVDVGANLGIYAIPAAVKGCRVLAIEALPENYTLLCQSVAKNALTSLTPVNVAAYDRATTVRMIGTSAWGTIADAGDGVTVSALPLDDLLVTYGFSDVDVLKMDIEGAEFKALAGPERYLMERRIREIVIEVNEPACRAMGSSGDALLRSLHGHGFHLYMFCSDLLVPRRFNEFRELYNCDFLATRDPLAKPPAGFTVGPMPSELSAAHVLAQANSPFEPCRFHVAQSLAKAPMAIRDDAEIRAAFARLQNDPVLAVRRVARATKLLLEGPRLSGIEEDYVLKTPAIASAASCEGRTDYKNGDKRIAVVAPQATYCGVAHYGRNFCRNLIRAGFNAELITFDDKMMRHMARQYIDAGNSQISEICERLGTYDASCLEFEPSTLGGTLAQMLPRLRQFMKVRRPLAIDLHSVLRPQPSGAIARLKSILGLWPRRRHWRHEYRYLAAWRSLYEAIREREASGNITTIVHTHEDSEYLERLVGLNAVQHHPLAYFDENDCAAILRQVPHQRQQLDHRHRLDPGNVLLGVFGFIGSHKGTHYAIEALVHLPENFKLIIFGQHHPTGIPIGGADPYLSTLVQLIEKHRLTKRVFFVGDLGDAEFPVAIASVDLAVFPYHEVGQRSSGPIQMAIELGMPVLCSRTHCFQALSEYYPDRLNFFDPGNYLHLAQLARDAAEGRLERNAVPIPAAFTTHTLIGQFDGFLSRVTT